MGKIGVKGPLVETTRGPFDPGGQPRVDSPNALWLGLFAWNAAAGCTASKATLKNPAGAHDIWRWENASRLLQMQDEMGLEFHLAAARWGLNIVTGWVAGEQEMSGRHFRDHEMRYDMSDEFITLMKWAWSSDAPFSFEGDYFKSFGAVIDPKPARKPRPFLVNAGSPATGIDFAAKQCDWLFCLGDLATVRSAADQLEKRAAGYGRHVESFTFAWLLIADTDARAQALYREIADALDEEAVDTFILRGIEGSQSGHAEPGQTKPSAFKPPEGMRLREVVGEERYLAAGIGLGGKHMIGSAQTVAEQLREMHIEGRQRGIMLSFFDYFDGLERLERDVLPILRQMGIWQ